MNRQALGSRLLALGFRLWGAALFAMVVLNVRLLAAQPPERLEEFVPIDQLPPTEQLPGGAFVVVAYAFIWVAAMVYLWSIWRRLGKVEQEMRVLQRRSGSQPR